MTANPALSSRSSEVEMQTFRALRVHTIAGVPELRFEQLRLDDIDPGDVVIRVAYAGVGFRDAMAAIGRGRNIRSDRPCVGGVDMSGMVVSSSSTRYREGDPVLVTNYAFGITHDGAFSEYVRVPAEWIVPLPEGLTLREAMILGSSGLTAGLAFDRLQAAGLTPDKGPIVITGATGGVGSLAVDIFSKHGYSVSAVTGKPESREYLQSIGATDVVPRRDVLSGEKLLGAMRWAGAVDNVGGQLLDRIASQMKQHGRIALCGLASGYALSTTVLPFILRGVDFLGINVGRTFQMSERLRLWNRLATDLKPEHMDQIVHPIDFVSLPLTLQQMLEGNVTGRVVVVMGGDTSC